MKQRIYLQIAKDGNKAKVECSILNRAIIKALGQGIVEISKYISMKQEAISLAPKVLGYE
jgi:hypothetical protein